MYENKSQFEMNWEQENNQGQEAQEKIDKNKIKRYLIPSVVVLGIIFTVLFSCGIAKKK